MSDGSSQDESKIVVDDDYKQRVQQEKAAAQKAADDQAAETAQATGMQMPPATFEMLVTTLTSQALTFMGQIPDPIQGKSVIQKPAAKHFIDLLAMLEEKTQGNLTEDEAGLISETLHQIRMLFVACPDSIPTAATEQAPSSIELP